MFNTTLRCRWSSTTGFTTKLPQFLLSSRCRLPIVKEIKIISQGFFLSFFNSFLAFTTKQVQCHHFYLIYLAKKRANPFKEFEPIKCLTQIKMIYPKKNPIKTAFTKIFGFFLMKKTVIVHFSLKTSVIQNKDMQEHAKTMAFIKNTGTIFK